MSEDNALLSEFSSMLDSLSDKRGILPNAVANLLSEMGFEEGKNFVTALLNASDEEYNKYIDNLEQRENLADKISRQVTTTQSEELQKELSEQFSKTPVEFFNIGSDSIANFGESFIKGLKEAGGKLGPALVWQLKIRQCQIIYEKLKFDTIKKSSK